MVGVNDLQSRKACIDKMNDTVGICSLVQKISRCPSELSEKLVIGDSENALHAYLNSFPEYESQDTVDETTTSERITNTLLLSKPFTCSDV